MNKFAQNSKTNHLSSLLQQSSFTLSLTYFIYQHKSEIVQVSWQSNLDFDGQNQFIVYLSSFYFGSTTILTVGYGDISPKNNAQVAIVTLLQFMVNKRLISESSCLPTSSMKQAAASLHCENKGRSRARFISYGEDQSTIKWRIAKLRARSYIIDDKPNVYLFVPEEETRLLTKFNEQLRNGSDSLIQSWKIQFEDACQVFFALNHSRSKTLQSALATKLIHVLFAPNDLFISQQVGRRHIDDCQ